jgi:pantothenate kinase
VLKSLGALFVVVTSRSHTFSATGGGAHKFADAWEKELGIKMDKQEELDSLVAGMQFVLSTVIGECYTFRPMKDAPERKISSSSSSNTAEKEEDVAQEQSSSLGLHLDRSIDVVSEEEEEDEEEEQEEKQEEEKEAALRISLTSSSNAHGKETDVQERSTSTGLHLNESMDVVPEERKLEEDDDNKDDEEEEEKEASMDGKMKSRLNMKTNVDEWWWSRKVQRDSISYSSSYPYLLVTIGTGVSVLRVDGPRKYERISGSTIGGGTYWGLMRLLTDVESFDDAMKLAEVGDPSKVDMMVGDIYGTNSDALEKLGLPANIVASSFGKLVAKEDPAEGLTQEDLARALLLLVTNNIGQVAHLNAKLSNTSRIYFVGSFLRENKISERRLSYAIDYWSKGEMEALFLHHEGYFGALGAFLNSQHLEAQEGGFFRWEDGPQRQSWRSRQL